MPSKYIIYSDDLEDDETPIQANLNLKRERSEDMEVPDERRTVRRRFMNPPEPEQAAAEEPERRFRLYITVNSINYELHLEDIFYDDDTTYRNIIEEVQTTLRREIAGYKDHPSELQLQVRPVTGIPKTIHLNTPTADNPVQDGDVIYATPLVDDDTIARALRDPNTASLFHKQMQVVQNQAQRRGGKTRKRLRKRKCNSKKRKRSIRKRPKKRKRTRKRR
jgi:hypothetical protein